ncbi:MAG TPA: LamG-like jellyroll fold domain-containing protein [Patescibacteria group bacterium]|nr:LamG-like jellyroll fold domain-containing protein [Patescibacteria group bacterium]
MKPKFLKIGSMALALMAACIFNRAQAKPLTYELLANPGAETINFNGWNLTNSGDSGFGVNGNLSWVHSGSYSFVSSYDWDTMSQEIDLLAKGYTAAGLDSQPIINASDFVAGHWPNGADLYDVKVELRDASHNAIASFDTGQQTAAGDQVWTQISHTFTAYGLGVRYIYFEQDGRDAEFWAGNYGAAFDDASVTIGGPGPAVSITSPASGQTLTAWSPGVNWGASTSCLYSYDNTAYTAVDCSKNGSDIPQDQTSLTPTLYILGIDDSANSTIARSSFTWQPANSLAYGLAGYWKLDESAAGSCAGGNDACDSSGNNHGTYSGSPAASTTVPALKFSDPRSLSFNGSTDYITINRPVANDFTICAWIKTAAAGNGTDHWTLMPIMDSEVSGLASDFGFGINSAGKLAYGNGGSYDSTITGSATLTDNAWHHACVTRAQDTGLDSLYVDGGLDATGTTDTSILNGNADARIGYGYDGTNPQYFNGLLDEVRAYQRVLNQSEIALLAGGYNSIDQTPPVITLLGGSAVSVQTGSGYIDAGATASDDVDGNLTSSIVVSNPVNTSIAGTYTISYNVSDSSGNAAATVTRTVTVTAPAGGGAALPPAAYSPPAAPAGGFNIIVNQGTTAVTSPDLTISSNAGTDIKYIALSTSPDFKNTGLIPYQPKVSWNLCGATPACPNGPYTIYAKFYTSWGQQSSAITLAVNLKQASNKLSESALQLSPNPGRAGGAITQTLKRGSRGMQVSLLQSLLAQDSAVYPEGQVSGYFGGLTQLAVQKFQMKYKIANVRSLGFGIVGPLTRTKLNQLLK